MSRPTTLHDPWLSLASILGGPGVLYALLMERLDCSEATAKRIARGAGKLSMPEWRIVDAIFREHGLERLTMEVKALLQINMINNGLA